MGNGGRYSLSCMIYYYLFGVIYGMFWAECSCASIHLIDYHL